MTLKVNSSGLVYDLKRVILGLKALHWLALINLQHDARSVRERLKTKRHGEEMKRLVSEISVAAQWAYFLTPKSTPK
jgi:hypothetical protein